MTIDSDETLDVIGQSNFKNSMFSKYMQSVLF